MRYLDRIAGKIARQHRAELGIDHRTQAHHRRPHRLLLSRDMRGEMGHDALSGRQGTGRVGDPTGDEQGGGLGGRDPYPYQVDLLFVDAGHEYEDVKADLAAWSRVVRPGGVIACHDFFSQMHPGVARAVLEFVPRDRLRRTGATMACWETEVAGG